MDGVRGEHLVKQDESYCQQQEASDDGHADQKECLAGCSAVGLDEFH